jgi:hypothetical protein
MHCLFLGVSLLISVASLYDHLLPYFPHIDFSPQTSQIPDVLPTSGRESTRLALRHTFQCQRGSTLFRRESTTGLGFVGGPNLCMIPSLDKAYCLKVSPKLITSSGLRPARDKIEGANIAFLIPLRVTAGLPRWRPLSLTTFSSLLLSVLAGLSPGLPNFS